MGAKSFGAATVVLKSFSVISIVEIPMEYGNDQKSLALRPICRECIILMILNVGRLGGTMGSVHFRQVLPTFYLGIGGNNDGDILNQVI
jgi:hypothetical protein